MTSIDAGRYARQQVTLRRAFMKDHTNETRTSAPETLDMRRDPITGVARDPTFAEATAAARARPGGTTARDFTGKITRCRGGNGCGGTCCRVCCRVCPMCAYTCACGDDCADVVWCWYGIPVPLFSCITFCACKEDESGAFIARDKQRQKSCALVPLDPSNGRYAVYTAHCEGCGTEFREDSEPVCVAEPVFVVPLQ